MKLTSRICLLLSIAVLMTGCKLAVIVVEGGEVLSTGSGTCVAGDICIVDVTDPNFSETFTAVPDTDWYFQKWNSGDRFFCGDATEPVCTLSFQGREESKAVEDMVASSEVFYLMPIFKPYQDTVRVDGKEWLQPNLFLNLSWDEINAVCPAGVCGDSGTLNGYDMTGWTWASVDDVKALFNVYIVDDTLDADTNYYQDIGGLATNRFFEDGWRPTFDGPQLDSITTEWRVMLRDIEPYGIAGRKVGSALALRAYAMDFSEYEDTGSVAPAELLGASFSAGVRGSGDAYHLTGAAFYR